MYCNWLPVSAGAASREGDVAVRADRGFPDAVARALRALAGRCSVSPGLGAAPGRTQSPTVSISPRLRTRLIKVALELKAVRE
ncbi:hypothetical protein chiPu_0001245 [Chiloscyllium punctatum]|uniref:Uncharacterized protein n=1 Tax=Chiloscyllium punctatum TaxID=137246 RepID=A0A401RXJ3_CHIPU|nr:hypothetical protein [Chiloscyllium punctatum]